jgi:hypothetical protein
LAQAKEDGESSNQQRRNEWHDWAVGGGGKPRPGSKDSGG